jgi:hypothetical protein
MTHPHGEREPGLDFPIEWRARLGSNFREARHDDGGYFSDPQQSGGH